MRDNQHRTHITPHKHGTLMIISQTKSRAGSTENESKVCWSAGCCRSAGCWSAGSCSAGCCSAGWPAFGRRAVVGRLMVSAGWSAGCCRSAGCWSAGWSAGWRSTGCQSVGCWSARLAQLGGLRRSAQQAGCRWSLSRVGRLSRVGGLSLVGGRLSVGGLLISELRVAHHLWPTAAPVHHGSGASS